MKVVKTDGSGLTAAQRCFFWQDLSWGEESHFKCLGIKGREGNHVSSKLDCSGIFYLCKHCSRNRITGIEIPDSKGYLAEITADYRVGKGWNSTPAHLVSVREGNESAEQFSKERSHQSKEMHLSITAIRYDLFWESAEVCYDPLVKIITICPGLCASRAPGWQGEGIQALIWSLWKRQQTTVDVTEQTGSWGLEEAAFIN